METISIDDFKKVEIRAGRIVSADRVDGSEKLLKLEVDFGLERRQVISGIGQYFTPDALMGKRCAFVTNLAPRTIMGLESQAMILATGGEGEPLYLFETQAPAGSRAR